METQLTKVTVPANYTDPELELRFEEVKHDLLTTAEIDGKHDGKINQPTALRQYKVQTIAPMSSSIQAVIELNHSKHQLICDVGYVQKIRKDADEQVKALQNEEKAIEGVIQKKKEEVERLRCDEPNPLKTWLYYGVLIALVAVEGGLTYLVVQQMANSVFVNILLSLAVVLITGIGLHASARYINAADTAKKRKWRYALVLGAALLFAIVLGVARTSVNNDAATLNSQIAMEAPSAANSALSYVAISFMAFWVALALELRYGKRPEDEMKQKAFEEKRKELAALTAEAQRIGIQINEINHEVTHKCDWILRRQVYARDFETRLMALGQQAVDKYESTNLDFRTDRQCPEFFGEPIDFGFKTYFQHILNPSKQHA